MSIAEKILERCSRPGGSDRASLVALFRQYQRAEARHRIDQLVDTGDVLRFTRRPANGKGRDAQQYFTDAADGARWAGEQNIEPRAASVRKALRKAHPKPSPVPITISKPKGGHSLAVDAPVIVPAGLRTTVLPSAPVYARHQLTEDAVVPSVVSSAECRQWVRALEMAR